MKIKQATTKKEKAELDRLLWNVLWKPLNLPRHFRDSLKLDTPPIELIAVDENVIAGALVANWLSEKEIEIRHLAVKPEYQENSIGTLLVKELFALVREKVPLRIQTYVRNTSIGFFTKLGFKPSGNRLDQPNFIRQGLWIQQMSTKLIPDNSR
jgi:N-acetylglutamate synthase-like GNAT family acetyltransferase